VEAKSSIGRRENTVAGTKPYSQSQEGVLTVCPAASTGKHCETMPELTQCGWRASNNIRCQKGTHSKAFHTFKFIWKVQGFLNGEATPGTRAL
jgi:hypothetical protein